MQELRGAVATAAFVEGGGRCPLSAALHDYVEVLNSHGDLSKYFTDDGVAVLEATLEGTHAGAMGDLQPTGRHVSVPYCVVYDLDGDRIRAARGYLSSADLMRQLTEENAATDPAAQV